MLDDPHQSQFFSRWARKGRNRWIEIEFDGGEGGDTVVEGVAIAFFRGHRRIAFFDVRGPLLFLPVHTVYNPAW